MATDEPLKRLGGGRWETKDGRFAIEPQSGTWAVVDASQTNELGLPLVRGPFRSLTEAKQAIEEARRTGPAQSPLEDRIKKGPRTGRAGASSRAGPTRTKSAPGGSRQTKQQADPPPKEPESPPEPKWLRDLAPAQRRRARELIERLEKLEIAGAEKIARSEVALDEPGLTRLAVERSLRKILDGESDPKAALRAAVDALLSGRDRELEVRWRLVDERGRPLTALDLED